jgi:hypothetical protein
MVFENHQRSRTRERVSLVPILQQLDALNEDRPGGAASKFAILLTRAIKNVNAEYGSRRHARVLAFGQ